MRRLSAAAATAALLPLLLLAACAPARTAAQAPSAAPVDVEGARQMIVVTTAGWDSVDAVLQRYERGAVGEPWRAVGPPVPAAVGRSGLGWGTGVHPAPGRAGPVKREGDGRAPAGVFRLSSAFGYAPADAVPWIRVPYVQADASVECVDDLRSRYYNRRIDRDTIPRPDWASHEEMRRPDELYAWGVWVDHNTEPVTPGGGSCIFLHVWAGPGRATSGCTAFAADDVRTVLAWLDPRARPVLVQLPRDEYQALRGAWALP